MSKASDGKSYEVGYGVPPQKTKFKPGQSGNKKGRPKKTPLGISESAYIAVASEPITIKLNGKKTTVTAEQAVWLKIRQAALNGDAKAWKIWVQAREAAVKHGAIKPVQAPGLLPQSDFVWSEEVKQVVAEVMASVEEEDEEVVGSAKASDSAPTPLKNDHNIASAAATTDDVSDGHNDNQSSSADK